MRLHLAKQHLVQCLIEIFLSVGLVRLDVFKEVHLTGTSSLESQVGSCRSLLRQHRCLLVINCSICRWLVDRSTDVCYNGNYSSSLSRSWVLWLKNLQLCERNVTRVGMADDPFAILYTSIRSKFEVKQPFNICSGAFKPYSDIRRCSALATGLQMVNNCPVSAQYDTPLSSCYILHSWLRCVVWPAIIHVIRHRTSVSRGMPSEHNPLNLSIGLYMYVLACNVGLTWLQVAVYDHGTAVVRMSVCPSYSCFASYRLNTIIKLVDRSF